MKILIWLDSNGDLQGFTPGYPWVCGEAKENVSLPLVKRKELLKLKLIGRVKDAGSKVSEVECIEI